MSVWSRALPGARFALLHGPARRVLVVAAPVLAVAVAAGLASAEFFGQAMLLVFTVMGMGLARQSVGHDRLTGRSVLYFQRPVTPAAHYGAQITLSLGIFAVAAAVAGLAALLTPLRGALLNQWVHAIGSFYWGTLLLIMGMAISSLVRRRDLEVMLVILLVTGMQALIADWLGFAAARELLRWLLVPIDAVFYTWEQWLAGSFTIIPRHALHLVIYPAFWFAVLLLRLRREDVGAAEYHVV